MLGMVIFAENTPDREEVRPFIDNNNLYQQERAS